MSHVPKKIVQVCKGKSCSARNSDQLYGVLLDAQEKGQVIAEEVGRCECMGACTYSPNVRVDDHIVVGTTPDSILHDIERGGTLPLIDHEALDRALENLI